MRAATSSSSGRGSKRTGSMHSSPTSPPALKQRWGAAGGEAVHHARVATKALGNDGPQQGSGPGEWVRQLMDFGSWAPKSSRAWRLGQTPNDPNAEPDAVDDLQARLQQQAQPASSSSSSSSSSASGSAGGAALASSNGSAALGDGADVAEDLPPTGSFSEADDGFLSQMLSKRIQSMSGSLDEEAGRTGVAEEASQPEVAAEDPDGLSGDEMRELILAKYGKTYDVSLVRRDGFGKSFVAMNITWQHLEQRSFRMTEEQYMEKISSVAYLLNLLGQTTRVRSFLQSPAKSERGLPRRPVVGTAISVQLDLPQNLIDEFFGAGYY